MPATELLPRLTTTRLRGSSRIPIIRIGLLRLLLLLDAMVGCCSCARCRIATASVCITPWPVPATGMRPARPFAVLLRRCVMVPREVLPSAAPIVVSSLSGRRPTAA